MPIGRAIFKSGSESPVTALTFSIKKSAYLQYPSSAKLSASESVRKSFFLRPRSMRRAKMYPCTMENTMKSRNFGSPQP